MISLALINVIVFVLIVCRPIPEETRPDDYGVNSMFTSMIIMFRFFLFVLVSLTMWLIYFIVN